MQPTKQGFEAVIAGMRSTASSRVAWRFNSHFVTLPRGTAEPGRSVFSSSWWPREKWVPILRSQCA